MFGRSSVSDSHQLQTRWTARGRLTRLDRGRCYLIGGNYAGDMAECQCQPARTVLFRNRQVEALIAAIEKLSEGKGSIGTLHLLDSSGKRSRWSNCSSRSFLIVCMISTEDGNSLSTNMGRSS